MNKHLIILLSLCLTFSFGLSQEFKLVENPAFIQEKIIESNRSTESLKANFTQEKHMSILNKPFISTGNLAYKAPDKIKWEYEQPFSYIVVLVKNRVTIKDGDDLQNYDMSQNAVFKEINRVVNGMISGRMLEDKNFINTYYESLYEYKVTLVPTDAGLKEFIEEIHLVFDNETLEMKVMEMIEKEGDKTVVKFIDVKLNEEIPDETFKSI